MDLVADAHEPVAERTGLELGDGCSHGPIGQVHPADDPGNERSGGGRRKELAGLGQARSGLDKNRPIDSGGQQVGRQVLRSEAASDRGIPAAQPRIVGAGRVPQVVVSVDHLAHEGVGAPGAIRPSSRRFAQSAGGISIRRHAG